MNEAYFYRGHSIDLNLREVQPGRVRCTYFIDENYCFQSTTDSPALGVAREVAIARAHTSIDALDPIAIERTRLTAAG